jgi:hypothetical protein
MTGDQFLALSGKLVTGLHSGPAEYPSALSRAYYGAFHIVLSFLADLQVKTTKDHGDICRCLSESREPDAIEAGRKLTDLQSQRVKADYRLDDLKIERQPAAQLGLERAHEIRSLLERGRTEPARSTAKAGIEAYRQRIGGRGPG